ncbi:MAG: hypothetical protein J6P72_06855 [Firmicutes bacterium]|nr:hypothetical protein [Bacillota bacterium]
MICLADIFQDGMVLQRGKKVRIWGTSDKKQEIQVYLNEKELLRDTVCGDFELFLPPQDAMENAVIRLVGKSVPENNGQTDQQRDEIRLVNVDFGEVWIAGGQSNMEFMLKYDASGDELIRNADDPHLRFFDVGEFCFEGEREEKLKFLASHWDRWHFFEPEEAPYMSAVGIYYALKLRERLGVPVGIVGCNWGGTSASCWLPEEDLRQDPELKVYMDEYDQAVFRIKDMQTYIQKDKDYRTRTGSESAQHSSDNMLKNESLKPMNPFLKPLTGLFSAMHPMGPRHEWRPAGLYYTMQQRIAGFTCKGVIWYQGCSDDIHARLYARLLTKLIARWREDWRETLPFLFVQLAPFESWMNSTGANYPVLRAQQQYVADHVPDCYMASIMDIGSRFDIHPKNKKPVGERLSALAMHYVYQIAGEEEAYEAPRISRIRREGPALRVKFDFAPDGLELTAEESPFAGLEYLFRIWADRKPVKASYTIVGDEILIHSPGIQEADEICISFANRPYEIVNLRAKGGFPARPMPKKTVQ